jgi:hypothetical protein
MSVMSIFSSALGRTDQQRYNLLSGSIGIALVGEQRQASPFLFDFLMPRCRVYLRSRLNTFLPSVLAEPALFYF